MPDICFFCQNPIPDDAPEKLIGAYPICPECQKAMADGIPVIAIQESPVLDGQLAICKIKSDKTGAETPMYPTGEWAQFSKEACSNLFGPERLAAAEDSGYLLVKPDVLQGVKDIYDKTMMPAELPTQNPEDANMNDPEGQPNA